MLENDFTKAQPWYEITADQAAQQLLMKSPRNPGHHPSRDKLPRPANDDQGGNELHQTFHHEWTTTWHQSNDAKQSCWTWRHPLWPSQASKTSSSSLVTRHVQQLLDYQQDSKPWIQARITGKLKPGKDPANSNSFRPIFLLYHTYKLFERLFLNHRALFVDCHLILEQAGFKAE